MQKGKKGPWKEKAAEKGQPCKNRIKEPDSWDKLLSPLGNLKTPANLARKGGGKISEGPVQPT